MSVEPPASTEPSLSAGPSVSEGLAIGAEPSINTEPVVDTEPSVDDELSVDDEPSVGGAGSVRGPAPSEPAPPHTGVELAGHPDGHLGPERSSASWVEQVTSIEDHCVYAWPPTFVERTPDGWILRATPGLSGRGRSNHALPPVRTLDVSELDGAIAQAQAFAVRHGVECGLQVGPTNIHQPLLSELAERRWTIRQAVKVMTVATQVVAADADPSFELQIDDNATTEWMAAWAHCDPRPDVDAHAHSVFPRMVGIAHFAHSGDRAVGISVQHEGIVGLFCLAVAPERRRQGLGKALVRGMLAAHDAPLTYLQVFSENAAGLGLYRSLGFQELYRYRHALAPTDS